MSRSLCAVAALVLAACTDDPVHPAPVATKTAGYVTVDAESLCHILTTDCPQKTGETYDDCVKIYKATRVPADCRDKLSAASCDSIRADLLACWPECTGGTAECDGPNIIECAESGRKYTYECNGVCATQNKTWSGTCSLSYKGQTTGRDTCWCN